MSKVSPSNVTVSAPRLVAATKYVAPTEKGNEGVSESATHEEVTTVRQPEPEISSEPEISPVQNLSLIHIFVHYKDEQLEAAMENGNA